MKKYLPLLSLILVNIMPVIGVLFLGWNINQLLIIYLVECALVGVFNIIKMIFAGKETREYGATNLTSKLKVMMYSTILYFVLIFLLGMLTISFVIDTHHIDYANFHFKVAFTTLLLGCSVNFFLGYILTGKYSTTSVIDLSFAPYGRVLILGVLVFTSVYFKGKAVPVVFILVGAKLLLDIISYKFFSGSVITEKNNKAQGL